MGGWDGKDTLWLLGPLGMFIALSFLFSWMGGYGLLLAALIMVLYWWNRTGD